MEEASGTGAEDPTTVAAVEEEHEQEDGASASHVPEGYPAGRPPPVLAGADWSAALSLPETESWLAHMSSRVAQLSREVQRDVESVRTELHLQQFKEICVEVSGRSECVRSLLGTEFPLRLLSPACEVPGAVRRAGQRWHQLRVSLQVLQERLLRENNGRHPTAERSLGASMVMTYWDDNKKLVFQEVNGNIDTIHARENVFLKRELPICYNNSASNEFLKSFDGRLESSFSQEHNPDCEEQLNTSTNLSTKPEFYEKHLSTDLRMEFSELPWPSKHGKKEDDGDCVQIIQASKSEQLVEIRQTDCESLQERSAHQHVSEPATISTMLNESHPSGVDADKHNILQLSNVTLTCVDGSSNSSGTDSKSHAIGRSNSSRNEKCSRGLSENLLAEEDSSGSFNNAESTRFIEDVFQGFCSRSGSALGTSHQNRLCHSDHSRHELEADEEKDIYSHIQLGSIHSSRHCKGHSQKYNGNLKDMKSCLHYRPRLATSDSRMQRSKSLNTSNILPTGEGSFGRFNGTKASSMQSVLYSPETSDSFRNRQPLSSSRCILNMEYEAMLDFAYPLREDGGTCQDSEVFNDLLHQLKSYEKNTNPKCKKLTVQKLSTPFLRDDRSHDRTFCTTALSAHDIRHLSYVGEDFKRPPQGKSLSSDHVSTFKVMPVSCRGKKRNKKQTVAEMDDWYGSDEYLALPTQLKEAEAVAQNLENLVDMLDTSPLYRSSLSMGDLRMERSVAEGISTIRSRDASDPRASHKGRDMTQSELSVSLPHERPPSVCDSVESGPLCDIASDGMSPVPFSTSGCQGDRFCGSLNKHQNPGSERAQGVQQPDWKPRDTSSPVSNRRPSTFQDRGRHHSQLIKEIQDDIEHQINNTAIWEKMEMFVKKLDVLIDWLYNAMETTENWTPPKAEIDNLKVYLETHLCFKLNVDSHCTLKEEVVQEGRRLLEILVSQKSGLRDTLDRIESQWQQLQQQICRQHGWVQRALAIIKSDVLAGAETLSERGDLEPVAAGASQVGFLSE